MTRRDIIIIAALINAGLLAILFMLAINSDDDTVNDHLEDPQAVIQIQAPAREVIDIIDSPAIPVQLADEGAVEIPVSPSISTPSPVTSGGAPEELSPYEDPEEELPQPAPVPEVAPAADTSAKEVEVTVKSGDSLDKIARTNGTTVKAIKDRNKLKTDKLSIGQVLHVPVGSKKAPTTKSTKQTSVKADKADKSEKIAQADVQFYTVKSGDNPWKIAKQFNIKVDDLLKLNGLNEEKARNMKVGDKIRVR